MGVTIKQIALEVGVSWPAVSQILNQRGRFAPETRKKVLAAAAKHGYRPNSSARALREQSSKLVGVLFRNDPNNPLTNMSAFEYLLGINQRFQDADLSTLLIRAGELAQAGDIEPRVFRERMVDGVIVAGSMPDPLIERVRKLSQRVVWLDAPVWTEACCVRRDEHAAGHACVTALADLGYKHVAFVTRDVSRMTAAHNHHSHFQREAGATAAARERGISLRVVNWPEDEALLEYDALIDLISPDLGVVAGSLPIARRIDHGASAMRLCAGFDYGMVCCDDSFDTQVGWRGLSRVEFNRYGMGAQAAEMMLGLLSNSENLTPSLLLPPDPWRAGHTAWGPRSSGSL